MDVNEKIHIENHNLSWKNDYLNEVKYLTQMASLKDLEFEHIGSTSIPGIKAKPIIDIIVGVKEFPPYNDIIKNIEACGYIYMKESSVIDRLYFAKRGIKNFNIHVILHNGTIWKEDIIFRDYLITHPDEAKDYTLLKESIINSGIDRLLEYSKLKADFIKRIYDKMNDI